jgi:hypothetical protein
MNLINTGNQMKTNNEKYIISKISRVMFLLILATTFINKSYAFEVVTPGDDADYGHHNLLLVTLGAADL